MRTQGRRETAFSVLNDDGLRTYVLIRTSMGEEKMEQVTKREKKCIAWI